MTNEDIDTYVRTLLEQNFDCDTSILNNETNLFETYDLDSIDAVDLIVEVQKKYEVSLSAEDFKGIFTHFLFCGFCIISENTYRRHAWLVSLCWWSLPCCAGIEASVRC